MAPHRPSPPTRPDPVDRARSAVTDAVARLRDWARSLTTPSPALAPVPVRVPAPRRRRG